MAAFHGKGGSVTFDSDSVDNVLNWSIDATADISEATDMSVSTWKEYLSGIKRWTATVECNIEDTGPDPDVDNVSDLTDNDGAALVLNTGLSGSGQIDYYSGTAIVTGVSPTVNRGDTETIVYTFQGIGTLTEHAHA